MRFVVFEFGVFIRVASESARHRVSTHVIISVRTIFPNRERLPVFTRLNAVMACVTERGSRPLQAFASAQALWRLARVPLEVCPSFLWTHRRKRVR